MTMYVATIEVASKNPTPEQLDAVVHQLQQHHAAATTSPRGWTEVRLTLLAENLAQATATAAALVEHATGKPAIAATVLTETESDAREGWEPTPDLVSVPEAAELLGVSRQAVLQRINANTLPAEKVGRSWAIPRTALKV